MKVSFIVPVYNEERNVLEVIRRLKALKVEKEIVVVDDGSFDQTPELLARFKEDPEVVVHLSQLNFGKGTAIRVGLKYAKGDIVAIQDGDLEYDVNDYLVILKRFSDPAVNVVYGSRFRGPHHTGTSAAILVRQHGPALPREPALSCRDHRRSHGVQGLSARTDLWPIPLRCKGFEFCPEITAKVRKRGEKIHEVPISYDPRSIAEGKKIRARDGWIAIWTLLRLRFRDQ